MLVGFPGNKAPSACLNAASYALPDFQPET